MSSEVAAACEGAIAGGATEIVVKDAHDSACNIYPDMLPEQASILRSWARHPYSMMAGLDASFDGVMFTGYHSAASMPTNPLSHTMNGKNVYVKINDIICPELFINALTAAYEGKPIYLLTGDKGLCEWLHKMNANIPTVAVSEGMGGASPVHQPASGREAHPRGGGKGAVHRPQEADVPHAGSLPRGDRLPQPYLRHQWLALSGLRAAR